MTDLTRAPAFATPVISLPHSSTPLGYQQITSLATAQNLAVPTGAIYALIQATGQDVRWRDDGTAPTASVGMVLHKDLEPQTYVGDLTTIQFIQTAASSVLNVSYYG